MSVDGTVLGNTPFQAPVAVDPGERTFTAERGAQTATRTVQVPVRTPEKPDEVLTVALRWPDDDIPNPEAPGSRPVSIPAIALGAGEVGRKIEGPMAIVILGGLATSTILNLLVLPAIAARFARIEPRDATDTIPLPALNQS